MARSARTLIVSRGKNVQQIDLSKQDVTDAELAKLMLGPTGNLRAPTLRRGKKILVGFNADAYAQHIG